MGDLMYRPRRLRRNQAIRDMVAETRIKRDGLIQGYFVTEGKGVRQEIESMPGIYRESPDMIAKTIDEDFRLGIRRIMLFGIPEHKDATASSALGADSVATRTVKMLKDKYGDELFVTADVCLCAYTDSGHCGVIYNDAVDNDKTLPILANMALALAKAGCDCVGPSDMMDGRVGQIREILEANDYTNTLIMAYTAKYASTYYGPFRDACHSAPGKGDRKGYQMDWRNRNEASRELALDIEEGADIVMVKPALPYLDIVSRVAATFATPLAAYHVSGEYAMLKAAVARGWLDERRAALESLTAIKRAGADFILTYYAPDAAGWLRESMR